MNDSRYLQKEKGADALELVENGLSVLQQNPGSCAQIFNSLEIQLLNMISDEETLQVVVDRIFKECYNRTDFQVIGAQLCSYLSMHLVFHGNDQIQSSFRKLFLNRCQTVFIKRQELVSSYLTRKELIAFTKFMAQIMIHMRLADGGVMDPFPKVIVELLVVLLDTVSEETISCVDQVLRLTGSFLDQQEKLRPDLDSLFDNIRDIYKENLVPPQQQKVLLKLILLRNLRWIPNDICNSDS